MKSTFGLFEIYYRKESSFNKLARILSKNAETAIYEAKNIFKERLSDLSEDDLFCKPVPLDIVTLKIKNPA
ncbi:hypothetical protein [Brevibacillus sp. H7]|uniref:hypothetical protein n=1 Tax=Brevibacillus sp. H7 TaxID=3349138 RepID=UPI00382F9C5B